MSLKIEKIVSCAQCGKEHSRPLRRVCVQNFCSQQCYSQWQKGRLHSNLRIGKLILCAYCGKEHYRRPSIIRKNNFCSYQCRGKFYKGALSPNWRNCGSYQINRGNNWKIIRKQVYARDNHTCQICGKTKCLVHAHHIVPFRVSQDNSLENLITLCARCHRREEAKYYRLLKENAT